MHVFCVLRFRVAGFVAAAVFFVINSVRASEELWKIELEEHPTWYRVASDGSLLVADKEGLANYSFEDGGVRWGREDIAESYSYDVYPFPGDAHVFVEARPSRKSRSKSKTRVFEAISLSSGLADWRLDSLTGDVVGFLAIDEWKLLLAFELVKARSRDDSGLFLSAINAVDGATLWKMKYGDSRARLGSTREKGELRMMNYARPVVEDGVLYLPYRGLHAIDLESGELEWGHEFDVTDLKYRFGYASPVIAGDRVYAAGEGYVYAFELDGGREIWRSKLRSSSIVKEILPVPDLNVTIARTGGLFSDGSELDTESSISVQGIDDTTGKALWRYTDAKGGLSELHVDEERSDIVFADSEAVVGLNIEDGEIEYESPLVYWRLYGLFDEKQSGFSIGGGFMEQTGVAPPTGGAGGFGMGSRKLDLGANPIASEPWRDEIIIRGPHYIVSFAPSVRVPQWAAIFSDTKRMDRELRRTGDMPVFSGKDLAYYLTKLFVGKGGRQRQAFVMLGVSKKSGKIMSRHDFRSIDSRFLIDHPRDRLFVFERGRRETFVTAFGL